MLTHAILLITLASTPASQVLVLKGGGAMVVRSYEVDGALLRIVGSKGEPLVMRVSKIDLEASEAATERRQAAPAPVVKARPVRATRAPVARQSLLGASQAAIERGSSGGMSVADPSAKPAPAKPEPQFAAPRATGGLPDGKDTAAWQVLFDGLRAEHAHIAKEHDKLVRRYNSLQEYWTDKYGYNREDVSAAAKKAVYMVEIERLRTQLGDVESLWDTRKEKARRAGVKPIVYRSGLHK